MHYLGCFERGEKESDYDLLIISKFGKLARIFKGINTRKPTLAFEMKISIIAKIKKEFVGELGFEEQLLTDYRDELF